jgi:pimeloyl-ACP methyl ester carboxylesterase
MADYLATDGVRLHVEVTGADDAPTVVLVHGLAASIDVGWRLTGVLDRLGEAGLRTIAYDARAHGRSDAPHEATRYGDDRVAADLAEIVTTFCGPDAVVAGYSMGASTILTAFAAGLRVRGAAIGGAPLAVLRWSDDDELQKATAIAVLEERQSAGVMQWWVDFLDATGIDKLALAAFLRGHRPVIENWDAITTPTVVAAGLDDASAAPPAELASRLRYATPFALEGDHISAASDPAFTDAIITVTIRSLLR